MKRYRTIVVAMALDDRDATTLKHTAHFAQAAGSQIVYMVHVAPTFDLPPDISEQSQNIVLLNDKDIEHQLRQTFTEQQIQFPFDTQIECVIQRGSLVTELVRLAAQKGADLICVGRRPREDHDLLTESAMDVLRKAVCSTFLVPSGVHSSYNRILVPVDFSEHSREALDIAVAVATSSPGATITILHVYEVPTGYYKTGRKYEEFAYIMKKHAEQQWDKFSSEIDFQGVLRTVRFELSEIVSKTILSVAEEIDSHLIVMGSHGRTRLAGFLLGHVADSVGSKTTRPFLCVKRKGEVVNFLHSLLQLLELE
jgi:nucleotide-binding universal stress UspA family protein